jgi:DNA polymerase-3 subunit gamma/tau
MSYLVLARKYRPQAFGEMSGQEHVVRTLSNALKNGQLAHAFLFTGPRGVGKTSTARLVAKALNCEKGPTAEPCGVCAACVEIAEGRSVDVVEIDAASNNGVDNVRDIVEAVKYRPARDRYKVFVVDEVHMLSQGAFNALLKTLEEPPPHVKFVLATTDVHKVPETIVSRCQRFDFRRLTLQQIAAQLAKVAEAEGMRVSPAALALVARQAEGGMRDALSLLDQVRAACGEAPSDADVAEALGAVDAAAISRIAAGLVARDGAAVLAEIEALHARGLEMKRVAEEIVRHLRNVVVARLVPAAPLDLPDADLAEVRAQAEGADPAQLTRLFDLVQRAMVDVKLSEQPRYALEVALLEGVFLAPGEQIADLLARAEALASGAPLPPRGGGTSGGGARTAGQAASSRAATGTSGSRAVHPERGAAEGGADSRTSNRPATATGPTPTASPTSTSTAFPTSTSTSTSTSSSSSSSSASSSASASASASPTSTPTSTPTVAVERWRAAVDEVEKTSVPAASSLKEAALLAITDGEVEIALPSAGLHARRVETKRAEIEAVLASFFGRPTRLKLSVGEAAALPAPDAGAPAGSTLSIAQAEAAEKRARSSRVQEVARSHPNIRDAARILEGGIKDVEEL